MNRILSLAFFLLLIACENSADSQAELKRGTYRGVLNIQNQELPFNFSVVADQQGGDDIYVHNADEKLLLDEVSIKGDSIDIGLHVFDANIKGVIIGDSIKGVFVKNYETDYKIPFAAAYGQRFRFKPSGTANTPDFSGKYRVHFYEEADTVEAIGIFQQQGDSVTGSFLTATGDYRYLQGNVADSTMQLSTFDGNHAYLFTAMKKKDGSIEGEHYSGKTYHVRWTGIPDEKAALPDAESLTYLKPGYETIEFSFPDVEGNKVSLTDDRFQNKVVVLQLFGTWCPNCMDETKFLASWYEKNKARGVEIIGLAYERKPDFEYASNRVKKMADKFNVGYDFLIAGVNDKEAAAKTLPALNKVIAFPTTIFIGKDGKVKYIHTGFSGPGTGVYYEQFIEHFNQRINELLSENIASTK